MLKGLVVIGLTLRPIILLALLVFIGSGIAAFFKLNIEAYPNPAPVILEITAQAPGQSTEEMERYYTIPIEVGLSTTPGVDIIRSTSFYGLSFVRVTFNYGIDYYFAVQQAALNLQQNVSLPNNVSPAADPGVEPGRRGVSLSGGGPAALRADQSSHHPGLGAPTPLPDGSRGSAGQYLGWDHQRVRGRGRSQQA